MKQSQPYYLILLPSLLLAACGFEPMAATDRSHANSIKPALAHELASVEINATSPHDQRLLGQQFRTHLEDLVNPGKHLTAAPRYRLTVALSPTITPGFIAPDGKAQRFLVRLLSNYELIELASGRLIERGQLQRNSSYSNLPNSFFSTYVAEQDTMKRLGQQLAEEYRLKLASLLKTSPAKPSPKVAPPPNIINQPKSAIVVPGI